MATVINNPGHVERSDSAADSTLGILMAVIVLFVIATLFFVYALPAIRASNATPQNSTIDVNVKTPAVTAPQAAPTVAPATTPTPTGATNY